MKGADSLQPTEDFFNPLASPLADGVPKMPGRSLVNCRASGSLGHMRGDIEPAKRLHKLLRAISFVSTQRNSVVAGDASNYLLSRFALGMPLATVSSVSTTKPFQFSINIWPM
jgi:hypothetical protein